MLRRAPERTHLESTWSARVPNTFYARYGKRLFDVTATAALMLALAPLYGCVWLLVRIRLGQPIYYCQDRVGLDGQRFTMLKFRTMKPDRRVGRNDFDGVERRRLDKNPHDPRHTSLGRRLRRSSLDELPQLRHVLRGEMSLVGPRPEIWDTAIRERQLGHSRERVRPGVTGLWQVDSRDSHDVAGRLHLDDEYIRTMSFRTDVRILCKTVNVVFARTGH
ncbi:MAG: sugar transferase [Acidimicrobiia bacterium]|nr:sugar transferase [Acidimicrobiia bacterium]